MNRPLSMQPLNPFPGPHPSLVSDPTPAPGTLRERRMRCPHSSLSVSQAPVWPSCPTWSSSSEESGSRRPTSSCTCPCKSPVPMPSPFCMNHSYSRPDPVSDTPANPPIQPSRSFQSTVKMLPGAGQGCKTWTFCDAAGGDRACGGAGRS